LSASTKHHLRWFPWLAGGLLGYAVLWLWGYVWPPLGATLAHAFGWLPSWTPRHLLPDLVAGGLGLLIWRRADDPRLRRAWGFLSAGMAALVCADVLAAQARLPWPGAVWNSAAADGFVLVVYVLAFAFLYGYPTPSLTRSAQARLHLDVSVVIAVSGMTLWVMAIAPVWPMLPPLGPLDQLYALFLIGDLILLWRALVLYFAHTQAAPRPDLLLLVIAMACSGIGDIATTLSARLSLYRTGDWLSLVWVLGATAMAGAALFQYRRLLAPPAAPAQPPAHSESRTIILLLGATLTAYAALIVMELSNPTGMHLWEIVIGAGLILGLVCGRLALTLLDNTRLTRDLRRANAELTGRVREQAQLAATSAQSEERYRSECKQAEAEIRRALAQEHELSELRSRFINMTSHEFRTPLSTILTASELLERYANNWPKEKRLRYIHMIQRSTRHMTQMLEDLLILGRYEAGRLTCQPAPLDVIEFCHTLVEQSQLADETRQPISFTASGDCAPAHLDEKLLRQILDNLLSNALKYSPNGNQVHFTVTCTDTHVVFRIQDRGIGIPPNAVPHLYDAFYRASNIGGIPGTGLGLPVVKRAVDAHGGIIEVQSEVGVGTTFVVTLPRFQPKSTER
jgi:signal transduction histidine kinase